MTASPRGWKVSYFPSDTVIERERLYARYLEFLAFFNFKIAKVSYLINSINSLKAFETIKNVIISRSIV